MQVSKSFSSRGSHVFSRPRHFESAPQLKHVDHPTAGSNHTPSRDMVAGVGKAQPKSTLRCQKSKKACDGRVPGPFPFQGSLGRIGDADWSAPVPQTFGCNCPRLFLQFRLPKASLSCLSYPCSPALQVSQVKPPKRTIPCHARITQAC